MKFRPPPKRKRTDPPPPCSSSQCTTGVSSTEKKGTEPLMSNKIIVHETEATNNINLRVQQARSNAVAQAQQDGCKGNFKIFDSPFGNYLVPVIPTRAELGG